MGLLEQKGRMYEAEEESGSLALVTLKNHDRGGIVVVLNYVSKQRNTGR